MSEHSQLVLWVVLGYLSLGASALIVFDMATKRIRSRILSASTETIQRMGEAGHPMSPGTAKVFFLILMWFFWPAVFIGAARDLFDKNQE